MKSLVVQHSNVLVGDLRLYDGDRYEFQYSPEWLGSAQAFPISLAMGFQSEPFSHQITKSFFEGLIPEGDLLRQIEQKSSEPIGGAFDFLAAFGRDCAGALVITEAKHTLQTHQNNEHPVTWSELSQAFQEKRTLAEVILNEDGGFFSLAGAQDKIPVILRGEKVIISRGFEPTTHIIKPPNRYHADALDSVYNEHFCMRLADHVGLKVPSTQVVEDEVPFYLIERYDRKVEGSAIQRIHQQDFCQAQGVLSTRKYEILGGPSITNNYQLIREASTEVIEDSRSFLTWVFFNLLIGNNDSHSKNLSFLMNGQDVSLAPFYDLLSTAIYPTVRKKFAFKIAGQVVWKEISSKHLRVVERELKLKNGFLGDLLMATIEKIENSLPSVFEEMSNFREKNVFQKIENEISKRAKHFKSI